MAEYSTRIADLPENITTQIQQQGFDQSQGPGFGPGQNNYTPLNIHPNPYGIPPQPPAGIPFPEASAQRGQDNTFVQQGSVTYDPNLGVGAGVGAGGPGGPGSMHQPMHQPQIHQEQQQYRLPSRDIPMNTLDYQNDQEIQPNYVPKPKLNSDYIREYEYASEEAMKKHERTKQRTQVATDTFSQLQIPILVAVLFFVFQMPIINSLIRRYLGFMKVYSEDGNINFMGLILKSACFGSIVYSMQSLANTVAAV